MNIRDCEVTREMREYYESNPVIDPSEECDRLPVWSSVSQYTLGGGTKTLVCAGPNPLAGEVVAECDSEAVARLCALAPRMLATLRAWEFSISACQDAELWHHLQEAREATTKILAEVRGVK